MNVAQLETEWTVVGDAKSWMDALLAAHGGSSPFASVKLEQRTQSSLKRRDLTVLDRSGKACLTGEVKVPWAADGASPFVETTVVDARAKALAAGSPWFFTWNLNELVLWKTDSFGDLGQPRGFKTFPVSSLRRQTDLTNPRFIAELRDGIERFFIDFMRVFRGETDLPQRAPDEYFVHAFDSFLAWPVLGAKFELLRRDGNASQRGAIDRWMRDAQGWILVGDRSELLGRAAKFACYAIANKLVFYDALRKRYTELPSLEIPEDEASGEAVFSRFGGFFDEARHVTGDYETVFGNPGADIGSRLPFYDDNVVDGWRAFVRQLDRFDLSKLDYDVIGRIFERLIDPEERHKYGQYYTRPEVVDLINSFAISKGDAKVLDPGCGGGTFLVRAYARKKYLAPRLGHTALLETIYGTDISPFAAHLSTINLATRDLVEDGNYPRVVRRDFFALRSGGDFMRLPRDGGTQTVTVPRFDAIVGNPPYVRQEDLSSDQKAEYRNVARMGGLTPTGRADLHVYFWGQALALMAPDAKLGFLASSQWLDADYGFALQAWLLENFRIEAIIESRDEPWFVGARVQTVAALATREADPEQRDNNMIRFVELRQPISSLLQHDDTTAGQLDAADRFRDAIMDCSADYDGEGWRVRVERQGDLRMAGVLLGERTRGRPEYAGGKWGIPLRAPDVWEELLSTGGGKWRPLGELADVRFGVKSGCDAFFYVSDYSTQALTEVADDISFEQHYGVSRTEVLAGTVVLAKTGNGEVHPIEARYLKPIVHSLMDIDAYSISENHCDKLALMISEPRDSIGGTHVDRYIDWGESHHFHQGATCAARGRARPWYDLTQYREAPVLWSKAHQYRHCAPLNPDRRPVNCNLYTVDPRVESSDVVIAGILNSSLVLLSKHMFGRPVGVEGNLKTEVIDVNMMLVPDWTQTSPKIAKRIDIAMRELLKRNVIGQLSARRMAKRRLVQRGREAELATLDDTSELDMVDRQELDDAVLEMLGVTSAPERQRLRSSLYAHLRDHFEAVRSREEEAQDNRRATANAGTLGAETVANDVFAEIESDYPRLLISYSDMIRGTAPGDGKMIPVTGEPEVVIDLATTGVRFGGMRGGQMIATRNPAQAELVSAIAKIGPRGRTLFVAYDEAEATALTAKLQSLLLERQRIVAELVTARTADADLIATASSKVMAKLVMGVRRRRPKT